MPEKCPIYSFSPLKDESIRIRHLVGEDNQLFGFISPKISMCLQKKYCAVISFPEQ